MKIAVTGGTGFLGTPLVQALAERGDEVVVLTRSPARLQGRLPKGARAEAFDPMGPSRPDRLHGAEAVIHLAGENLNRRWTAEARREIEESRTVGTARVVEAALASGTVRALLGASAVGYYGPRGDEPLTEESPPGADFLARVCRAWEAACEPAAQGGIRTARLRLGVVLHPEGGALGKLLPLFRAGLGGRLGDGRQFMSWIARPDVVRLVLHVLDGNLEGPVNLTAPEPVTNAGFTATLAQVLHRPALFAAPALALKLALGEMSQMVLTGQRVVPARALASGFRFEHPSLRGALEALLAPAPPPASRP